jgi:hypothetical protein
MKSDDQLLIIRIKSRCKYQYMFPKVSVYHSLSNLFQCWLRVVKYVFFVYHSEASERKREKKNKQASFYCT